MAASKIYGAVRFSDNTLRLTEPAASTETALARAVKLAEKHGEPQATHATVTAENREAARDAAIRALPGINPVDAMGETPHPDDANGNGVTGEPDEAEAVTMTQADYLDEVETFEAPDAETLAEVAADTAQAEDDAASDEAAAAEARRRADKEAKAEAAKAPKWFRVAIRQGSDPVVVVTHSSFATAEAALAATDDDSPFDGMATHSHSVMAIQAKSEAAAVNYYEALEGVFPESRTLATAAKARENKPVTPPAGPGLTAWVPKESETSTYYVSKSGILHPDPACRFVKVGTTPVLTDETQTAVTTVLRAREDASVALPKSDDGKITARWTCASCSGSKVKVEVEAAPEPDAEAPADTVEAEIDVDVVVTDAEADGEAPHDEIDEEAMTRALAGADA